MPSATYTEESPFYWPEGWIRARIASCEEKEIPFTLKETHPLVKDGKAKVGDRSSFVRWEWKFVALNGLRSGEEISVLTDPSVTWNSEGQNNTASLMIAARGGNGLPKGQVVSTDSVIGLELDIKIENGNITPKRDNPGEFWYNSKVTDWAVANSYSGGQPADPWANESSGPAAQSANPWGAAAPAGFTDEPPF